MKISTIDRLFDACFARPRVDFEFEMVIEQLLAQSLLINICAEFERKIKEITNERGFVLMNSNVCDYDMKYAENKINSANPTYMKDVLSDFGEPSRRLFAERRRHNDGAWMAYHSILQNRNSVAHRNIAKSNVSVTIGDTKAYYDIAHEVLDWFKEALSVGNPTAGLLWEVSGAVG